MTFVLERDARSAIADREEGDGVGEADGRLNDMLPVRMRHA
jgi:hypothetical protein